MISPPCSILNVWTKLLKNDCNFLISNVFKIFPASLIGAGIIFFWACPKRSLRSVSVGLCATSPRSFLTVGFLLLSLTQLPPINSNVLSSQHTISASTPTITSVFIALGKLENWSDFLKEKPYICSELGKNYGIRLFCIIG